MLSEREVACAYDNRVDMRRVSCVTRATTSFLRQYLPRSRTAATPFPTTTTVSTQCRGKRSRTKKLVSTDAMSRFFRPVSKQQAQTAADAEMDAASKAAKSPENRLKQSLKRAADNWAAVNKQGSSHKKKQKPRKRSGRPLQLFKQRGRPRQLTTSQVCFTITNLIARLWVLTHQTVGVLAAS